MLLGSMTNMYLIKRPLQIKFAGNSVTFTISNMCASTYETVFQGRSFST